VLWCSWYDEKFCHNSFQKFTCGDHPKRSSLTWNNFAKMGPAVKPKPSVYMHVSVLSLFVKFPKSSKTVVCLCYTQTNNIYSYSERKVLSVRGPPESEWQKQFQAKKLCSKPLIWRKTNSNTALALRAKIVLLCPRVSRVVNFVYCISAKNYENWLTVEQVINGETFGSHWFCLLTYKYFS